MSGIGVTQLGNTFFAEVTNVDLKLPLDDQTFFEIHGAFMKHGVLLFARQHLSDEEQVAFSFRFGPLEDDLIDPSQHIARMSNLNENGSLKDPEARDQLFLQANQQWHSDSTFLAAPAKISILSGHKIPPEGGETQWADLSAAWQALPAERQAELDGLIVEHDFQRSRRKTGHNFTEQERKQWLPLPHPLVRRHEETGQKALYVGSQAEHIIGMPEEEGAALIAELIALTTQDQFTYTHPWTEGDLVIWDNRRVNHRGRPWQATEYPREIHRTTVKGTAPTVIDGKPIDEYERWQSLSQPS
ncbi:MAG: TauD/TfdA family dioxygenase [Rhodospirillaceae bacterium]|jgi:alpha-ketoglutarate-dependent 2,4-dichlorophenoxyacetate dioxygenase|nr:TauD/TfdA family dioxygenase [Rhodospirillaceae bacterium]